MHVGGIEFGFVVNTLAGVVYVKSYGVESYASMEVGVKLVSGIYTEEAGGAELSMYSYCPFFGFVILWCWFLGFNYLRCRFGRFGLFGFDDGCGGFTDSFAYTRGGGNFWFLRLLLNIWLRMWKLFRIRGWIR